MSEDKKKPPTPKKLRDAREDGETTKSQDAIAAGVLAGALVMFWVGGGFLLEHLARLFALVWTPWSPGDSLAPVIHAMGAELLLLTLLPALATAVGGGLSLFLQGAVTMSMKPVMLRLEAVSPTSGFKRLFGMKAVLEACTTLLEGAVLLVMLYFTLRGLMPLLVSATARSPELLGLMMWQQLLRLLAIALGLFVVFGLIDYGIQRAMFLREHRMSEDEVKRENKELMGNPEIKQARKDLAHEILLGDAPAAVASSNMVVANPTHFAVAISYRPGGVPQVVAKGQDAAALQIRGLAEALEIPVIVNPPLARTLYKVPVGAGIPRECFQAVGLMLHWVQQLKAHPGLPMPKDPA